MGATPKNRISAEDTPAKIKLQSWKEIAAYLDRDPRTVQLWEKLEDFPVHRLNHNARASVYAYTDEIDLWFRNRSEARAPALSAAPDPEPENPAAPAPRVSRMILSVVFALSGLILLSSLFWTLAHRRANSQTPPLSLAILPFDNQTSTEDAQADSLTAAVSADIGRLGKVPVLSSRAVASWKGMHPPAQEVAARLHVSLILRGTVADADGELQATVELLAAPGFTHLWGATYRREREGAEPVLDDIASSIAVDVTRAITGSAPQVVFPAHFIDPRARQLDLTARFYWNQRDLENLQKAVSLYHQALALDPKDAEAYAGLAECYDLMTDRGVMTDREAFDRAKAAAQSALAIDPGLGEAYNALAFAVYREDWDFARADQLFQRAIRLDPDWAVTHQWYGEFLGDVMRFDESISELLKAKALDPLSPMVGADLADGYMHAGRLAEADAELQRISDLYPDFLPAHTYRIGLSVAQGKLARAESEAQICFERTGDRNPLDGVRILRLVTAGKSGEARAIEARLLTPAKDKTMGPYTRAQFLFMMGRIDEGYAALEQAYRDHSWWMVTMMVDPAFGTARIQPRFLDLARRVGLPVTLFPRLMAQQAQPVH